MVRELLMKNMTSLVICQLAKLWE